MDGRPLHVLLIDDNPADRALMREVMREVDTNCTLSLAEDGADALAQLRGERGRGELEPDLVILDLNMPRMDGREFLAVFKSTEAWKAIPVVVMTTSSAPEDIERTYRLKANCYVRKPSDYDSLLEIVQELTQFWSRVAKLPPRMMRSAAG